MTIAATPAPLSIIPSPAFEELLIRADRATVVASLARGMAHDLRGPLQTLTLLVDPHADLLGGSEGARLKTAVSDAVQHLADTIGCFGRVYAPNDTEASPVIVDDLLAHVVELQSFQRGLPALEVELRLTGGLPPVRGIEADLRHILLSLVSNAKQALLGREDGELTLSAGMREGQIEIVVEDNGRGLSEAAGTQAFEPFFTTHTHHLGIGLTVARWLASRDGGALALEPRPRQGTRAVLLLPTWRRGA